MSRTETEIAYIAGLFDGEGCVSSTRQFVKGKYEKQPRVSIQLSITNQNKRCLDFAAYLFGGSVTDKGMHKRNRCYVWRLVGKQKMKEFLLDIMKYTIVKTEQICLALTFIDTLREDNLGCNPLPVETHELRNNVHIKLKECKLDPDRT